MDAEDDEPNRRQVTIPADLEQQLVAAYPAANSPSQAIVLAAQDGLQVRTSYGNCFEDRVRSLIRDELGVDETPASLEARIRDVLEAIDEE